MLQFITVVHPCLGGFVLILVLKSDDYIFKPVGRLRNGSYYLSVSVYTNLTKAVVIVEKRRFVAIWQNIRQIGGFLFKAAAHIFIGNMMPAL